MQKRSFSASGLLLLSLIAPASLLGQPYSQRLSASDPHANGWFGVNMATNGTSVAIAASGDVTEGDFPGAVYVFEKDGGGRWDVSARLEASDAANGRNFGAGLTFEGDEIVVGASDEFSGGKGATYVFRNVGGTWIQKARIVASDGQNGDMFGSRVALSGDVLAIAAPRDDDKGSDTGSVYLYRRVSTDSWSYEAKIYSPNPSNQSGFGSWPVFAGNSVIVGDPGNDAMGNNSGAFHVYTKTLAGGWIHTQTVYAIDAQPSDTFGAFLTMSGDTLYASAPGRNISRGAVYAFKRLSNGSFTQTAVIVGDPAQAGGEFGIRVSEGPGVLAVGSGFYDSASADYSGAVYYFQKDLSSTYPQVGFVENPDPAYIDQFGRPVLFVGSERFIAAYLDDSPLSGCGSVYVYTDPISPPSPTVEVTSVQQDAAWRVHLDFALQAEIPAPVNGYDIKVLVIDSSDSCDVIETLDDSAFDDVTPYCTGDLSLSGEGGSGQVSWNIPAMPNGALRDKYYANGKSIVFRLVATPQE